MDPSRTVLVIVDMENEFCKPGGKLYKSEWVDPFIPPLKELLERCRAGGSDVIFVQSSRFPDSPEFNRFSQPTILLKGTWASSFIEEISPRDGEPVVEKHTHDCFYNTAMDRLLEDRGIFPETHTIIIAGIKANICVYHAILGFHVRHYKVMVPLDCCAGSEEGRRMVTEQMSDKAYCYNVTLTEAKRIRFEESR
ncbi:MAG: cysteine hydrolase [Deltaproteobacteria bacterium]|nr:cysteine hydrolase [Deltaproteobacteria bacterium]MBW2065862.1 cysteine hydrolase [Deltaproteobacteria bacterium]